MKNITLLLTVAFSTAVLTGTAQLVQRTQKKEKTNDWYNASFEKDGIYGSEVNRTYEFLKGKKLKKKPIVAVIGYGLDAEHEDLVGKQWINPKEKEDGKDNDGNGWVDDMHGWNFLGNAEGEMVEKVNKEGDREFLRLKPLYEGIFFNGKDYVKFDDNLQKPVKVATPANEAEYRFFRYGLQKESELATTCMSYYVNKFLKYYLKNEFDPIMKKSYPNLAKAGQKEFTKATEYIGLAGAQTDSLAFMSRYFFLINIGVNNGMAIKGKRDSVTYESIRDLTLNNTKAEDNYKKLLANSIRAEEITGNHYDDINQKNYGNNNLYSNGSFSGTMISGIIAAERNNGIGIDGIMPEAQLMSLRAYPREGEAYYKDIALAIRYAVDNQADVIMLGPSNTLYPEYEAKWVNDALLYAEQKGILVVSSVWDLSRDLAKQAFYPNQFIKGKELKNFIQVAASDSLGMPFATANIGEKQVHLFAPGVGIQTTYMGTTYRSGNSSLFAGATVAATAAMIKAYYPNLTAVQIRDIILKTVTDRKNVEVEKQVGKNIDQYLFSQLCTSGGILNTYQAIQAADRLSAGK
ncbi:S8 family serine peptidase [Sphingobacterium sp. SRCM116780]|uniref:S8 family serine peptidase n=1 Tax=Sphingobacterium sp. SRCM116780 TaxID=2907623 RepID=UPI001F1E9B08|nr:S8 family serine peptidase [Sphingobacterium sp. SRCM116780]UIR54891.1 S8 family serine peptidase [Sphingobacterium sp. SRCM116780]